MMFIELLLSVLVAASPLPPPHPSAIEQLNKLPSKSKSLIRGDAKYRAPIPDSLKDRFEVLETSSGITIELEIPERSEGLVRLPGPNWSWPHGGCYMCLGNHLISRFGQSKTYLDEIGRENWGILYNNLYNDPTYEGVKGPSTYYYGSSYSSQSRGGFFRRRR